MDWRRRIVPSHEGHAQAGWTPYNNPCVRFHLIHSHHCKSTTCISCGGLHQLVDQLVDRRLTRWILSRNYLFMVHGDLPLFNRLSLATAGEANTSTATLHAHVRSFPEWQQEADEKDSGSSI